MAQGSNYLSKGKKAANASAAKRKAKVVYGHKRSAKKYTKKGNPTKEIRRGCGSFKNNGSQQVTGMINRNIEEVLASRVLSTGSMFALQDVQASGKARLKDINRAARTKKKSRVEEKLIELEKQNQDNMQLEQ